MHDSFFVFDGKLCMTFSLSLMECVRGFIGTDPEKLYVHSAAPGDQLYMKGGL